MTAIKDLQPAQQYQEIRKKFLELPGNFMTDQIDHYLCEASIDAYNDLKDAFVEPTAEAQHELTMIYLRQDIMNLENDTVNCYQDIVSWFKRNFDLF